LKRFVVSTIAAAVAVPLAAPTSTAATAQPLAGVTGPGFTISVKKAGRKVTRLRPGTYRITVADRSAAHDFVFVGPGVRSRMITGLGFTGTRSVTVTLRRGRYEYYCTPHRRMGMRGYITVS
jgi:plastocyanin